VRGKNEGKKSILRGERFYYDSDYLGKSPFKRGNRVSPLERGVLALLFRVQSFLFLVWGYSLSIPMLIIGLISTIPPLFCPSTFYLPPFYLSLSGLSL